MKFRPHALRRIYLNLRFCEKFERSRSRLSPARQPDDVPLFDRIKLVPAIFSLFAGMVLGIMLSNENLNWYCMMAELMSSGVELMIVGMGIVYLFLALLVVAINVMSALVQRFFPEQPKADKVVKIEADNATVAAISAAVHQYRNKNR